jgi:hypothetical protein
VAQDRGRDPRYLSTRRRRLLPLARAPAPNRRLGAATPRLDLGDPLAFDGAERSDHTKLETYRRGAVPNYWIIEPQQLTLLVYRLTPNGNLRALTADANSGRIRAEPFEIEVAVLLGGMGRAGSVGLRILIGLTPACARRAADGSTIRFLGERGRVRSCSNDPGG